MNDSKPKIQATAQVFGLSFTKAELKFWGNMRHAAAYGSKVEYAPEQIDFFCCQSMFYRMVLSLIASTGPRIHYGYDTPTVQKKLTAEDFVQTFNLGDIKEFRIIEPSWPPKTE